MRRKRARTLLVLLGILLVLGGVLLYLVNSRKTPPQGENVLTDLTADRIAEIRWVFADGRELWLKRSGGAWKFAEDEGDVDQKKASKLAASVTGAGITASVSKPDLSSYGLDPPASELTLVDNEGGKTKILMGGQNEMTQDVYCIKDGKRDVIYAVKPSILAMADLTPEDYRAS